MASTACVTVSDVSATNRCRIGTLRVDVARGTK